MSEQNQEVNTETQTPPQLSEVEQQALEYGWKPEDEFKADPANEGKKWRTAEDFMDRKSLFDKIDSYHRKVKDLEKGMNALAQHNSKIEKSAYERALRELRNERKAALEEGDLVKAEEIRDRIDEIKEQTATPPVVQPQTNPVFDAWVAKNQWYVEDRKMQAFADGLANQMIADGVKDPHEVFAAVEREVRETFPTKFRNPRKDTAPNLDVSAKKAAASDGFKLTPQEEKIMQDMIRAGAPISKEEYIKQIKESRGVK